MKDNKEIRVAVASAKDFERGTFKTYRLDEKNGISVVVAASLSDGLVQAQSFLFDLDKNENWNFSNADSYARASLAEVNKLAQATKGSSVFKTLASAANENVKVPIEKVRSGLRITSASAEVIDKLILSYK